MLVTKENTHVAETELVVFKPSPIHGVGGFAKIALKKRARVMEYVGERISKGESVKRCAQNNEYIFTLNEEEALDGNVEWNPARFFNHSCVPNCDAEFDEGRIWIVTRRDVEPGEELTFNYGFDLEDYRQYPCHCGSMNCVGFVVAEEFFPHVRKQTEFATEH